MMPKPMPKKPAEKQTYGIFLDIRAEPTTADEADDRSDFTAELKITDDGRPFCDSTMTWHGMPEPVVKWLWDQFGSVTGSKYFASQGLTYGDVVRVEAMLIKILAELNRRAALLAKAPGDKAAATARIFASV